MITLRGSSSERDQFRGLGEKGLLLEGAAPGREGELSLPRGEGEAGLRERTWECALQGLEDSQRRGYKDRVFY